MTTMSMPDTRRTLWARGLTALLMTVAATGAAACGAEGSIGEAQAAPASKAAPAPAAPAPAANPVAPSVSAAGKGSGKAASPIPAAAKQLIVAVTEDWSSVPAQLSRWERGEDGSWRAVGKPWTGVVGSGTGWGRGLHGEGPPAGQSGPTKAEGDGKAPAGVFALGGAYGYAKKPLKGSRWPYTAVDKSWHCVDDSASKRYGTIVDADEVAKDWSSSEIMKRGDALYTWVLDVAHNPAHVAKAGSCIFLHVWRAAGKPTVGCTAMPKPSLEAVLSWLDPAASPTYVLLPRAAYAELAAGWGLPKL